MIAQEWREGSKVCSLDEATRLLPAGAYTTFRTYHKTGVLLLEDHFKRLEESAHLVGAELHLEREPIRACLRKIIDGFPFTEARVRICIPIIEKQCSGLYVMVEELLLPDDAVYKNGVRTITKTMKRDQPAAKMSSFIETTNVMRQAISNGVNEILMVDVDGKFLEGFSSNLFVVSKDIIYTAGGNILAGITRKFVLEIITDLGLPLVLEGFPFNKLDLIEEVFITSTSRGVMPVSHINDIPVGNAKPGKITRLIAQQFEQKIGRYLDEI